MRKTLKKHYTRYSDPGHSWMAVKRNELIRLGILHLISSYSYQKGETVYLEEDCDLRKFERAKTEKGESWSFTMTYREKTPIRRYKSFFLDTSAVAV